MSELATGDILDSITLIANYDANTITLENAIIKAGSEDVTSNYKITYVNGKIIIDSYKVSNKFFVTLKDAYEYIVNNLNGEGTIEVVASNIDNSS